MTRIVCVSDTHSRPLRQVPAGDILVHGGDFSVTGQYEEVKAFMDWIKQQPHRLKVFIAGNHDVTLDNSTGFYDTNWERFHHQKEDTNEIAKLLKDPTLFSAHGVVYLENSGYQDPVTGLKFWGSPNQKWFGTWAFANIDAAAAQKVWSQIPSDTDVLITHGPPAGACDGNVRGESCGCEELTKTLERVQPVLHVFGHIHEAYGTAQLATGTLAINACTCDYGYKASQPPVVVELEQLKEQSDGDGVVAAMLGGAGGGRSNSSARFQVASVTKCWGD